MDLTSPGKRTLTGDIKIVESKTLDTVIANVFYENALPFNVADSSSFAVMFEQCIKFCQQHPGPKYKVPNQRRIGGALLDSAYELEDTGASVQPSIDRAKRYGGTLTSDGWSDVHRRPITTFMLVTRESAVRKCSVTAGAQPRTRPGSHGVAGCRFWPGSRVAGRRSATPCDPANPDIGERTSQKQMISRGRVSLCFSIPRTRTIRQ